MARPARGVRGPEISTARHPLYIGASATMHHSHTPTSTHTPLIVPFSGYTTVLYLVPGSVVLALGSHSRTTGTAVTRVNACKQSKQARNIHVIDQYQLLCDERTCSVVDQQDQRLLYKDDGHLTNYGTAKIVAAIQDHYLSSNLTKTSDSNQHSINS